MAKVILENTRPHDITLHAVVKDIVTSVTIPAAKEDPDDRTVIVNGRAEADSEFIAVTKKFAVVRTYFNEGWLRASGDESSDKEKKSAA